MIIRNLTRKKILSAKAQKAKSFKDKTFGLIFEKDGKALILDTRFGIHTHLMSRPIDVLIVNKNGRIMKIKEKLLPNKLFFWSPKYSTVIELPKGTIKKSGTKTGDKIEIKE